MPRKTPVTESAEVPEGVAPEAPDAGGVTPEKKPAKTRKFETPFQKVQRRLERAKRAYEKLEDGPEGSEEAKAKAKAKAHLDGCVMRYSKVADPQPETEVAEPVSAE